MLLAIGIGTFTYAYFTVDIRSGQPNFGDYPIEKLAISSIVYDSSQDSIILTVKSIQVNITLNNAFIKDTIGNNVAIIPIDYLIQESNQDSDC